MYINISLIINHQQLLSLELKMKQKGKIRESCWKAVWNKIKMRKKMGRHGECPGVVGTCKCCHGHAQRY